MTALTVELVTADRPELLDALVEVRAATEHEVNPGDPLVGAAELAGEIFATSSSSSTRAYIGICDGRPIAELILDDTEHNPELTFVSWLATRPEHRRMGIATAMLRSVVRDDASSGRTSLLINSYSGPGAALATGLGLTARGDERCSRLRIADADTAAIERWLEEGNARSDGYRLVPMDGPTTPEHLVPAVVASQEAMRDAPLDDIEYTQHQPSTEALRSREATWISRGLRPIRTLAIDRDGNGAGYTDLFLNEHRPTLAFQGDTGVLGAHRGRGLGRWLKAANHLRALATEPRVEVVETWNAQSNPWMLDINVAMGFRPHQIWTAYQGDLAEAVRLLD